MPSDSSTYDIGYLFEDIVLTAYTVIQYYAYIERAPWIFFKLSRPKGGRGHNEVHAPDFVSLGYAQTSEYSGLLLIGNEAKNFDKYPLRADLIKEKILDRFRDFPSIWGLVTGHFNLGNNNTLLREAKLWEIKTPYQILPKDSIEKKMEICTIVLRQLAIALSVVYGKTMNCLCSKDTTLIVHDKYTIEISREGQRLEKFDLRKLPTAEPYYFENSRPLDFVQWRETNDGLIEFYMPSIWNLEYADGITINDYFGSHSHIGFRWL